MYSRDQAYFHLALNVRPIFGAHGCMCCMKARHTTHILNYSIYKYVRDRPRLGTKLVPFKISIMTIGGEM
jgi:hypothetical protein